MKSCHDIETEKLKIRKRSNISKIASLLFLLSLISFLILRTSDRQLQENSERTYAIIKNIKVNYILMNQMDGGTISNYFLSYRFETNQGFEYGNQEITFREYSEYFERDIKIGDTIEIIYNTKNINQNSIVKLNKIK